MRRRLNKRTNEQTKSELTEIGRRPLRSCYPCKMKTLVIIFLILVAGMLSVRGQEFDVMFYNVENLFDTVDDTTRNDDEFLPGGSRR